MFIPPRTPLPIAKSNLPEVSTENTTNGGIERGRTLYVPRQVILSNNFATKDNNNSSIRHKSLLDQPTVITKNLNTVVIKKGESRELQGSGNSKICSPLTDDIVNITNLPTCVSENCCRLSGETAKDSKKETQKMVKLLEEYIDRLLEEYIDRLLEEYIDRVLYVPSRRPLPVFEEMCRA